MATTKAAEYTGIMLGKYDRTVRLWKADFRDNGSIPDSKQGRYQRSGILWPSEDLNKKAHKFVQENTNMKGRLNLTKHLFCRRVNDELLPNSSLDSHVVSQLKMLASGFMRWGSKCCRLIRDVL